MNRQKVLKEVKEWASTIVFALAFTQFAASAVQVDGASMMPTLRHGEVLLLPKIEGWAHRAGLGEYHKGDIVVFKPPGNVQAEWTDQYRGLTLPWKYRPYLVKRVVGTPGDTVQVRAGVLYVNGRKASEPSIMQYWATFCHTLNSASRKVENPNSTRACSTRKHLDGVEIAWTTDAPAPSRESMLSGMLARAVAHVSQGALRHNLQALSRRAGVPLLLPVKADAYGHGLELVSSMVAAHPDVWGMAVATPQEAARLAALNLAKPVVLLTPPTPDEIGPLADLGVRIPVGSMLEAELLPAHARAHLKVETGMNRLGARPADAIAIGQYLAERGVLEAAFTHFATADEPDYSFVQTQLSRFQEVLDALPPVLAHSSNGGGILTLGKLPGMSLARPGLTSYGFAPPHLQGVVPLTPVMTLKTRVNQIHTALQGENVSYSGLWTAPRDTRVAVLGMGYADGYPRNATLKSSVLIGGEVRPTLGRICMDQMMVDITGLDVQVGDWAELWGTGDITVIDIARWGGIIEYEVLTGLGSRVERRAAG